MKKYLLIYLFLCTHMAFGQKMYSFSLSGTINLDSGNIQFIPVENINDYPDHLMLSPTPIVNGKFHMEGKIPQGTSSGEIVRL